eukprot:764899-Hanusia_phi.AAC.3
MDHGRVTGRAQVGESENQAAPVGKYIPPHRRQQAREQRQWNTAGQVETSARQQTSDDRTLEAGKDPVRPDESWNDDAWSVATSHTSLSQASTASAVSASSVGTRRQSILAACANKPDLLAALQPFEAIKPWDSWDSVKSKLTHADVVRVGQALEVEVEESAGSFAALIRNKRLDDLLGTSERPGDEREFERMINARWGREDQARGPYAIWSRITNRPECFLSRLDRYLDERKHREKRLVDLIVAMAYLSTFNWSLTSEAGRPFLFAFQYR